VIMSVTGPESYLATARLGPWFWCRCRRFSRPKPTSPSGSLVQVLPDCPAAFGAGCRCSIPRKPPALAPRSRVHRLCDAKRSARALRAANAPPRCAASANRRTPRYVRRSAHAESSDARNTRDLRDIFGAARAGQAAVMPTICFSKSLPRHAGSSPAPSEAVAARRESR